MCDKVKYERSENSKDVLKLRLCMKKMEVLELRDLWSLEIVGAL